jgi:hypothetical protein
MPQFDTFSFSSQLFWVFLSFTLLYFSLTYYLLPAISVTLKIRKRKLGNLTTATSSESSGDVIIGTHSLPIVILLTKKGLIDYSSLNFDLLIWKQVKHSMKKLIPLNFYFKVYDLIII